MKLRKMSNKKIEEISKFRKVGRLKINIQSQNMKLLILRNIADNYETKVLIMIINERNPAPYLVFYVQKVYFWDLNALEQILDAF